MQEVYNGKTFPPFVASDETVAIVELQNKAGDTEYLYLPTNISSMNKVKERLQVQDYWEMEVTGIENLRLPDILVPMPENIDCVEALTLFNETCQAVKRFDEVQMTQLAMVVEFTGFNSSTEVTSIARLLGEFEVNPFVHNDEEYGKYMVEESGLFDVDELLLPHINYAAFAADKRQGTLVQSGYVENGFVGATRELSEYQQYNGEFADPLEIDEDCYETFKLYSLLTGNLFEGGCEQGNLYRSDLTPYAEEIAEAIENEYCVGEEPRGLMVLDNASPAVLGHLSKNIRIAVLKTPLVDEDVGIAASIRIVNPQSLKKSDFVDGGTATDEMLDFLAECLRYGISICVAGATSSGKTTLAGWLLTTIPDNKRIFTIENGSRELALVREKDGKVTNSVIHTLTRFSENEKQNIDQDMLLDMALRFNPEIICVGEMRSSEAYTAQESARTGHTVLTTIHSNSCESTYSRMRTLCKRKYDMDDEVLMDLVTEAFPIVVFTKQLENKKRRLMEIMECEITPDGKRHFNSLFRYEITENRVEGDKFIINGTHKKVCGISESLKKRFLENGMPREVLNKITGGGASVC